MAPTTTTPKAIKYNSNSKSKAKSTLLSNVDIHPLTPAQTHEPSSDLPISGFASPSPSLPPSATLPRRSVRLASISKLDFPESPLGSSGSGLRVWKEDPNNDMSGNGSGAVEEGSHSDLKSPGSNTSKGKGRVKGKLGMALNNVDLNGSSKCEGDDDRGKGFLNLRSGKKVVKRGMGSPGVEDGNVENGESRGRGGPSHDYNASAKRSRKTIEEDGRKQVLEKDGSLPASKDGSKLVDSRPLEEGNADNKGKRKLDGSSGKSVVIGNVDEGSSLGEGDNGSVGGSRFTREEKGKGVLVDGDLLHNVVPEAELVVESNTKNSANNRDSDVNHAVDNVALQDEGRLGTVSREPGHRRMERFRDIARENASRFAHFGPDENVDQSSPVPEEEHETEDWPGPFSTAMKIIRDRGMKSTQAGCVSSEKSLPESITWVPKRNQGYIGARFSVPSLQELCLKILANNVDSIVSLDSVPDSVRHRLSQLLCDSRKLNNHFFELLVRGSPTEIRLRDCSWLSEDQCTKSFQTCDTANLVVLQLDQCGRCMPDYVLLATLAQSPRHLPRLTTLSLSGACRLSDGGLRALVSSAPALRSINLSQCSLLTSSSLYILADSLGSLLKELYLDDCQGIDATIIVPALKELEHLEVLSVAGIETVCDEFVKDYIVGRGHSMKELVLKDCVNLTDASVKVIAEHCPGLCALDLVNLCKLTDLSIGYLTNGCQALHTLKLCRNPFSDEAIAAFVETTGETLKELSLNNIKKVGHHTALSLASHAKNLHTLDLSWCRNLRDNALGLIVDSCLSLRLLKLFGCTQVTDIFLNGHSNPHVQIIGLKMSPVLQHVKVPDPHQGALHYSSASANLI